ncbi:GNAT family N-acetyltransferase [Lysinibacillus sp. NPDC047702]|uniref:GNAT family N-acetyltransferase n=1 Tax=unclassified Lysinibacillus TaxID=2636778 RepID=UPI003D091FF6
MNLNTSNFSDKVNVFDDISLRTATEEDRAILYRIFEESRMDLAYIEDENVRKSIVQQQYELDNVQTKIMFPGAEKIIIQYKGEPIGRYSIDKTNKDYRLIWIGLLHAWRRKGIGKYILKSLMKEASYYIKGINLEVVKFNTAAYQLYEELGFKFVMDKETTYEMYWRK